MLRLSLFLLLFLSALNAAVDITPKKIYLLPYCEYTIVGADSYTLDDIKKIPGPKWSRIGKNALALGFKTDSELWLKCTLENPADKKIHRVLEMDNPHTGYVALYADGKEMISGALFRGLILQDLNPYFNIFFHPKETKTIFLKFSSPISTLTAKPVLWSSDEFKKHENIKNLILGLFFGAMGALLIYNMFILLFTRDVTYFWYCAYLLSLIVQQTYATGILELYYIQPPIVSRTIINLFIALPLIFIPVFTRYFLDTPKTMPIADKVLKYLPIYCFAVIFVQDPKIAVLLFMLTAPIFIVIPFLALKKRLHQSVYYAAGWISVLLSMVLMALIGFGFFPSLSGFNYIPQMGFAFEALIFSIGLADRINTLKAEKEAADRELIDYHKEEQVRLQDMVHKRTKALTKALEEKSILLKEVHHRVKNNLQMVVSLLQLQGSRIPDKKTQNIIVSAQSRIDSMGKLHELLYRGNSIAQIDTELYFRQIVEKLVINYRSQNIRAEYDITADLDADRAIYCGLIINELVTNTLKYAFGTKGGDIFISFKKDHENYILSIEDNGVGMDESSKNGSIGLVLVNALASKQLKGSIKISVKNGTRFEIVFPV